MNHRERPQSRRDFLMRAGAGFGGLALSSILGANLAQGRNPLAPKDPHHAGKAKSVIFLFCDGGPSHIDLFDPKPTLRRLHGQPLPASFPKPVTAMGITANNPLMASTRKFARHGQAGTWISDWLPEISTCADDLAVVRSVTADGLTHVASVCQMNTGSLLPGRPSLGAWSLYGLGSVADNLPGFVVLADSTGEPPGSAINWANGFLPVTYQGTRFGQGETPILYTDRPVGVTEARQKAKVDFINGLNQRYAAQRPSAEHVDAQIAALELAYKMQASAPEVADLARESEETQHLYGLDRPETLSNGRNCLLARRLVERGVRFVQLYLGAGSMWDAHVDLDKNHTQYCQESDRPIAGLLKDLKRRGLLESTLVIWGGEFGRTPMSESGNGRDHNPYGFTMWMAGGGIKGGVTYGGTDELGLYAVDNPVHLRDVHATALHCLGLDHHQLTYLHNGRDERATINGGRVIQDVVA